jgi:hypothetical protein
MTQNCHCLPMAMAMTLLFVMIYLGRLCQYKKYILCFFIVVFSEAAALPVLSNKRFLPSQWRAYLNYPPLTTYSVTYCGWGTLEIQNYFLHNLCKTKFLWTFFWPIMPKIGKNRSVNDLYMCACVPLINVCKHKQNL